MNKNTAAPKVSPHIIAMFGGANSTKPDFVDRLVDSFVESSTEVTKIAGRLTESFDSCHFEDGQKAQRARNAEKRAAYWSKLQQKHGWTDEELAYIIAS